MKQEDVGISLGVEVSEDNSEISEHASPQLLESTSRVIKPGHQLKELTDAINDRPMRKNDI